MRRSTFAETRERRKRDVHVEWWIGGTGVLALRGQAQRWPTSGDKKERGAVKATGTKLITLSSP